MWDLTIPGNNDHDFYVLVGGVSSSRYYHVDQDGATAVLVHNNNGSCDIPLAAQNAEQVAYGGTDLSQEALVARVLDGAERDDLYAVARYIDANGDSQTLAVNSGEGKHAESNMIARLAELGIIPADVTDLYVEYFPCDVTKDCLHNIIPLFTNPEFKLTYSFEWNSDPLVQEQARTDRVKAIADLWPR